MAVLIAAQAFDPWQALQDYQTSKQLLDGQVGATNVFVGTMRDFNDGSDVTAMCLEHYPGMTEKQLEQIIISVRQQTAIQDALIVHRVGDIFPNEPIVLVAVWSSHRGDAFDACRLIMEALKSKAPFWKKERLASEASRWVEANTDGYQPARPA